MKTTTKVILGVSAAVVLGAGGFAYYKYDQAAQDTARITTHKETTHTAQSVEQALNKQGTDFSEASGAIHSSGMLDEAKQLELLTKQLENTNPATRLAASSELIKMHAEKKNAKAAEILKAAAEKETDPDVRGGIEVHFARVDLDAAGADKRFETLKAFAADKRSGYRVLAAQELAKLATPEAKELVGQLAKDPDENVQIAAEEAQGGSDGEGN